MGASSNTDDIEEYIAAFPAKVRTILKKIRSTIRKAVPEAGEKISYRIPAFTLGGKVFIFYAAFNQHIGLYPPVSENKELIAETAAYRGEKGNLQLPLDEPMPYELIGRIAKFKAEEMRGRASARKKAGKKS